MSATAVRPTDEQVKAYAEKLPAIYRTILAVFPKKAPRRRPGDGLHLSTILRGIDETAEEQFAKLGPDADVDEYRQEDVTRAIEILADGGILARNFTEVRPTDIGERLIAATTGHRAKPADLPALPAPIWS